MLIWNDDLTIGNKKIDDEHKRIFAKANEIINLSVDSTWEEIKGVFTFLMEYAINHFHEEERIMLEISYENFLDHRSQHNYFIEELYKIYNKLGIEDLREEGIKELKELMINWVNEHINGEDKVFIKLIK